MLGRIRKWRPATWIVLILVGAWIAVTYLLWTASPQTLGHLLNWLRDIAIWFFPSILGAAMLMLLWLWRRPGSGA